MLAMMPVALLKRASRARPRGAAASPAPRDGALARRPLGSGGGKRAGSGGEFRLPGVDRGGSVLGRGARRGDLPGRCLASRPELRLFRVEAFGGGVGVAADLGFVPKIGFGLRAPRDQLLAPRLQLRFLAIELGGSALQPLERAAAARGLFAQRRKPRGRDSPRAFAASACAPAAAAKCASAAASSASASARRASAVSQLMT